jgi:hypothetical protein
MISAVSALGTPMCLSGHPDASSPPAARAGDFLVFGYHRVLDHLQRLMIGGICERVKAALLLYRLRHTKRVTSIAVEQPNFFDRETIIERYICIGPQCARVSCRINSDVRNLHVCSRCRVAGLIQPKGSASQAQQDVELLPTDLTSRVVIASLLT